MEGESLTQVEFGSQVDVELLDQQGRRERLVLIIVGEEAADMDAGLLSEQSPLAKAILGRPVGSVMPYRLGDMAQVRILGARRVTTQTPTDAAARRQALLKKALNDAERTNAEMFASSFSGKWGDYDPAGVAHWEEKPPQERPS